MNTQSSRYIEVEHVTLDKSDHNTVYELAPIEDIVLAALETLDNEKENNV